MHWFAAHLYVTGLIIAGLLLLTGALVVNERAPLSGTDMGATWGGTGTSLFSGLRSDKAAEVPRVRTEDLLKGQAQDRAYTVLPIGGATAGEKEDTAFNWEALMAQLVEPQGKGAQTTPGTTLGAYSFIPQGLISVRNSEQERDEKQEVLFEYGNTIGSFIVAFDDSHANMLQILKDAYQDRGDAQKVAAAERIGKDYIQLGADIESVAAPEEVGGLPARLGGAYKKVGQLMIAKVQAKNDNDFLAAVNAYNAGVDEFQKAYLALVTLFEVSEVQFSEFDPGSVFMFQTTSGF